MPRQTLKDWKPGDDISADRLNETQRVVQRLDQMLSADAGPIPQRIKLVRLTEVVGEELARADENESSGNLTTDRVGVVVSYDYDTLDFEDQAEEPENITDPLGLIYDIDDVVPVANHAGKYVILSGRNTRHAVTCVDEEGEYPEQGDSPNVYPVRFVALEYPEVAGNRSLTRTFMAPGANKPDAYVYNLHAGPEQVYIPENTIIWCYKVRQQWYTQIGNAVEDPTSESAASMSQSEQCKQSLAEIYHLVQIAGFDSNKTQVLGHIKGCLAWIGTRPC